MDGESGNGPDFGWAKQSMQKKLAIQADFIRKPSTVQAGGDGATATAGDTARRYIRDAKVAPGVDTS